MGAELVMMGESTDQNGSTPAIAGMFWRFLVADDPIVDRYKRFGNPQA